MKTFKQFLKEDSDEDILAGMDKYEDITKPFYRVGVHKADNDVVIFTFHETKQDFDEKDWNTDFFKSLENNVFVSTNNKILCGDLTEKNYMDWFITTYNKEIAQQALTALEKQVKAYDLNVTTQYETGLLDYTL